MSEKDFCISTLKDELPRFVRVFKAFTSLPADKLDYKHTGDIKGKSAIELIIAMAVEASAFPVFLTAGKINFKEIYQTAPANLDNAIVMLEAELNKAIEIAIGMSNEDWDSEAVMTGEGEWATTKGKMAWAMLLDLIHHRGQLSTYLRPMGGMVPSIYGPSADSKE